MVVVIGMVAISVDYSVLVSQHRNLQAFADEAAIAGAEKLNSLGAGSQTAQDQQAARIQAFIYLRDNLLSSHTQPSVDLPITALNGRPNCGGGSGAATAAMPNNVPATGSSSGAKCQLPDPLGSYVISICTPGNIVPTDLSCDAANLDHNQNTISVRIQETVANSFAGVVGIAHSVALGSAEAQFGDASLPFALYSHGCVTTGNQLEVVGGDVYVDTCTLQPQSSGLAGFCAERSGVQAGNIVFGPLANLPVPAPLVNQSLATCQASFGGLMVGMGNVYQRTQSIPVPSYTEPPGFAAAYAYIQASLATGTPTIGPATHTNTCHNGSVEQDGSTPTNCYSPGVYTDVGVAGTGIANNLNPGVYYITGATSCAASSSPCVSVSFTGNTMNANWPYVADQCWNKVLAPGQYSPPCPSGFLIDPQSVSITDPQCTGSTQTPLVPPTFTVTASSIGGTSLGSPTGAKYFVRVTAVNRGFESLGNELGAVVTSVTGIGSLSVNILPVVGATSYNIYVSAAPHAITATTGNDEMLVGANVSSGTTVIGHPGAGSRYPIFDTSSCSRGFHNIPKSSDRSQNNGVTFVLLNNASLDVSSMNTVLLSPFCASLRSDTLPAPTNLAAVVPPVAAGTACPYADSGAYDNDGAFVIYAPGPGGGAIQASKNGTFLAMSGTVFAPTDSLVVDQNAQLQTICGQGIFRTVQVQSGNHLNPSFYYPCANSVVARPANGVKLIR